jgi:hypothetical protein
MNARLTYIEPPPALEDAPPISVERRRQLFASALAAEVASGARVKSQGEFEAVVVRRVRPRRLRHVVRSLFIPFWFVVWFVDEISLVQSKKRQRVSVDERGRASIEPADEKAAAAVANALRGPQVAGTFVSPKGATRRTVLKETAGFVGGVAGVAAGAAEAVGKTIGGALGEAATEARPRQDAAIALRTGGYVAVGEDEVAVIAVHIGLKKPKVGPEVVACARRSSVVSAEVTGKPWPGELRIKFDNGSRWDFELPRIYRDTGAQVVAALTHV